MPRNGRFGILSGYLKGPKGVVIVRVIDQIQNFGAVVRKELGRGVGDPEGCGDGYYGEMMY